MLKEDKTKKDRQSGLGEDTMVSTKDGLFSIPQIERLTERRD